MSGRPVNRPINPTKTDTKFLGWYTDLELVNKFDFNILITQDITLYAKWGTPSFSTDSWQDIKDN